MQTTNNVSISKSNDVAGLIFTYTNTTSSDVLEGANLRNRHNLSLRTNYTINPLIQMDAAVRYTLDNLENRPYGGWSDRNPMKAYLFFPRDMGLSELMPWKDTKGNAFRYTLSDAGFVNPYWSLNECWNADQKDWLLANMNIVFNLHKDLKFLVRGSIDSQNGSGFDFTNMGSLWAPDGKYSTFRRSITSYQSKESSPTKKPF